LKSALRKPRSSTTHSRPNVAVARNPDLGVSKGSALTTDEQLDRDIAALEEHEKQFFGQVAARADVDDRLERTITSRLGGI